MELSVLFDVDHGSAHVVTTFRANDMGGQCRAAFWTVRQLACLDGMVRTSFARPRIGMFSFGNRHDGISYSDDRGNFFKSNQPRTFHPKSPLADCQPQGHFLTRLHFYLRLYDQSNRVSWLSSWDVLWGVNWRCCQAAVVAIRPRGERTSSSLRSR